MSAQILITVVLFMTSIICLAIYEAVKYKRLFVLGTVTFLLGLSLLVFNNYSTANLIVNAQFPNLLK